MILLKYAKRDSAVFLAHLNVLRHLERTLRRAEIPVKMSAGFHPHMNIFMANPLGLGLASNCEYVAIDTDMSASEVLRRYNAHCIPGLEASACWSVTRNPNVAAAILSATYVARVEGISAHREALAAFFAQRPLILSYHKNGKDVTTDITDRTYGYAVIGDTLSVTVGSGTKNVRPDKLASALKDYLGISQEIDFIKTETFVAGDGCFENTDAWITANFCEVTHA